MHNPVMCEYLWPMAQCYTAPMTLKPQLRSVQPARNFLRHKIFLVRAPACKHFPTGRWARPAASGCKRRKAARPPSWGRGPPRWCRWRWAGWCGCRWLTPGQEVQSERWFDNRFIEFNLVVVTKACVRLVTVHCSSCFSKASESPSAGHSSFRKTSTSAIHFFRVLTSF